MKSRFAKYALIAVGLFALWACQPVEKAPVAKPSETRVDSVIDSKKPEQPGIEILPFPKKFSIARRDIGKFSASIEVGNQDFPKNGFTYSVVTENRFGCYSFAKIKWEAFFEKSCPHGMVVHNGGDISEHGGFAFVPFYGDSEYPPATISVWKVRGDSLDFYAVLDKCFDSKGWETRLQIDSLAVDSSRQKRLFGRLQWTDDETSKKISHAWSVVWVSPSKLIFD